MEFAIRASAESTGGAFSIVEEIHPSTRRCTSTTITMICFTSWRAIRLHVGGPEFHAGPGDLVFGPRGVPHAHRRVVPRTGRILEMFLSTDNLHHRHGREIETCWACLGQDRDTAWLVRWAGRWAFQPLTGFGIAQLVSTNRIADRDLGKCGS